MLLLFASKYNHVAFCSIENTGNLSGILSPKPCVVVISLITIRSTIFFPTEYFKYCLVKIKCL